MLFVIVCVVVCLTAPNFHNMQLNNIGLQMYILFLINLCKYNGIQRTDYTINKQIH